MARSATATGCFPYDSKLVCYIGVKNNGEVVSVGNSLSDRQTAYYSAQKGLYKLYAVWPGQYRSDLFEIDNLNELADALGIPRADAHIHDVQWKINRFDDGRSLYATIDVKLPCGCSIDKMGIRKFAADMKAQKGWEVAVSTGYSHHYSTNDPTSHEWTINVRRRSLR